MARKITRKLEKDMTQGSISGNLLRFALPLLIGNLFQQLYNMVDTWVIGQSGNTAAYAAVGSIGPITNTLIGFFAGFASGAGVLISQYYAAKDEEGVSKSVHTSIAMTLVFTVLFTILGVVLSPALVGLMLHGEKADPLVYEAATTYLRTYFYGVAGLLFYNMCSGIMRAIGDSSHPFYFLVISTLMNIALDLVFVNKLNMGAFGVALATVLSQAVSAILSICVLLTCRSSIRIHPKKIRFHKNVLWKMIKIGIPAAFQLSITAFSNVFVQSYISGSNGVQAYNMAAWTTYSKIDGIMFLPMQSLALASTTFVAQNLGVRNIKRAKKGLLAAYLLSTGITAVLIVTILFFGKTFAAFFNPDPEVVRLASMLLTYLTPFYLFSCVNQVFAGAQRGAGNSIAPMCCMLGSFVLFRQIYLFIMSNFISNDLLPIGMAYPAGWIVCAISTLIYYFCSHFGEKVIIDEKESA